MADVDEIARKALGALQPPPKLCLSEWIERTIVLPAGVSALPGKVRLYEYQKGIADAISDPTIERISVVKAARIGYTTLLTAAIGSFIANDPCPVLVVLPTEADARDYCCSDLEPTFTATPGLRQALSADMEGEDRSKMLSRRFPGGSLKIVAAKAPRNLRRHTCRILVVDESDACEDGAEGNPILLAERRTLSFPNRKIIIGSTPVFTDTSHVLHAYGESDCRVYEVPCPECGEFTEILWEHIKFDPFDPDEARFGCPHCGALVEERYKPSMVAAGRWRATRPDVKGHAGFRLNALISTLANASWSKLAREFLAVKDDPTNLQTFVNTCLGQGWRAAGEELDDTSIMSRAEGFGLDNIPEDVLCITAGGDLQDDRIEIVICGWTRGGVCYVLAHVVIWGTYDDPLFWREIDGLFLQTTWQHPLGGKIKIDGFAIDSGDGEHMASVYKYAKPRQRSGAMAVKGLSGNRPPLRPSVQKIDGIRLWLVGSDTLKGIIFAHLSSGSPKFHFSKDLEPIFYDQLTSERRVTKYKHGRPIHSFERVSAGARAETLDALVYACAAKERISAPAFNWDRREGQLRQFQGSPGRPNLPAEEYNPDMAPQPARPSPFAAPDWFNEKGYPMPPGAAPGAAPAALAVPGYGGGAAQPLPTKAASTPTPPPWISPDRSRW